MPKSSDHKINVSAIKRCCSVDVYLLLESYGQFNDLRIYSYSEIDLNARVISEREYKQLGRYIAYVLANKNLKWRNTARFGMSIMSLDI